MAKQQEMTCILCPMGCRLTVTQDGQNRVSVSGNTCKRGAQYGEQELLNPMRVVTSSVRITGASMPLCPVKTQSAVPKDKIFEVLSEIRSVRAAAPIEIGAVLRENLAGTGVNLVATGKREKA